jgi:hypothetical protein
MKRLFLIALTFPLLCHAQESTKLQPMFNGKDLSGWVVVNTAPSTWRFDDMGMLICSGKPTGEIRTATMYQNFIMELEWRHMVPGGNAGVFVWADDITAKGQPFHRSVEVQVLDHGYGNGRGHTTHGDIFPIHGATMKPINGRGGSRAFPTENRSKPSPEWNHYRIECQDGNISLAVNGKVVTRGEKCHPRKGYICLESEGGIVHYRNIRIKKLPDTAIQTDQIAIANRGYRPLYSGVDLSGWQAAEGWQPHDWTLKSQQDATPLTSKESFAGSLGFVLDVRCKNDATSAVVKLGDEVILTMQPKGDDWHRYEGRLKRGTIQWTINGKPGSSNKIASALSGRLTLQPNGAADWANIYVRSLP